jgi:hypothetical protein
MRIEMRTEHLSATGEGFIPNLLWYTGQVLTDNLTIVGLILLAVGVYLCFSSKDRRKILLPLFPIVFIVFISASYLRWERWVVPVIPFVALVIGYALVQLPRWIEQRINLQAATSAGFLMFVIIAIPLTNADLIAGNTLAGEDTRTVAREWLIAHVPPQSNILVEVYTPEMPSTLFNYYRILDNGNMDRYDPNSMNRKVYRPGGHIGRLNDLQQVAQNKIQYIVASNIQDRYLAEQARYPKEVSVYQQLLTRAKVIFEVEPESGHRAGPPIHIYEVVQP